MKAITVLQPWAAFLAYGVKHYETRSWSTDYRGEIAIHAGKSKQYMDLLWADLDAVIRANGLRAECNVYGAVMAVGELVNVHRVEDIRDGLDVRELLLGDYSANRFAWEIANVRLLPEPVTVRGMQRLWEWNA